MAAPSFPDYHVTGPVHHYVRVRGSNNAIYYLGTCETTPKVQTRVFRKDIFNDIAGRDLPAQRTRGGQAAVVGCLMTRYSKTAYSLIQAPGIATGLDVKAGQESRLSRGALCFGRDTFEVWQVFENAVLDQNGALGFRTPGLEMGLYWPQVELMNHDRDTLGTEGEKLLTVFDCQPIWVPYAGQNQDQPTTQSAWILYYSDDASFPAEVRTPQ